MACGAVERLVTKYGEERGVRALKTLVAAKRAPVAAHEILAVSAVLFDPKFGWHHSAFDLVTVIRSKSIDGWHRPVVSRMKTATGGTKAAVWKGIAEAWVRRQSQCMIGKPARNCWKPRTKRCASRTAGSGKKSVSRRNRPQCSI